MNRPICRNKTHALKIYLDIETRTCKRDLRINAIPVPYEGTWATNRSIAFTFVLPSEDSEMPLTLIRVFLQIKQTHWCLCGKDIFHKPL
jgi:hypothetical protein